MEKELITTATAVKGRQHTDDPECRACRPRDIKKQQRRARLEITRRIEGITTQANWCAHPRTRTYIEPMTTDGRGRVIEGSVITVCVNPLCRKIMEAA